MALEFDRVAILGAGLMGCGIAEVALLAGSEVIIYDINTHLVNAGVEKIKQSLAKKVAKAKLTVAEQTAAENRLKTSTTITDLVASQLVIEAITENFAIKSKVFQQLDELLPAASVIASNTSSIPIMKLGATTKRADKVVGLHFFNPVPAMPLVEIIHSLATSKETINQVTTYAQQLGKTVVSSADRSGFIVNALLVPYLLAAIRMVEVKFSSPENIDTAMKLGANHPMGPLELSDFVGLDTIKFIADAMYAEYLDINYAAPPLLNRMVEAGYLGRKSGKGFYDYK